MQKINWNLYFTPYTNISSKWTIDINLRAKGTCYISDGRFIPMIYEEHLQLEHRSQTGKIFA